MEKALCPIYVCLSLVTIASLAIPFLNDLASHGKSRSSDNTAADNATDQFYHEILHGEAFLLPKRMFLHFYVTGIFSVIISYIYVTPIDDQSSQNNVAFALLMIHLVRRCMECLYVHAWRPTSKMHLAGYALGVGHYLLLPLVFMDTRFVCEDVPFDSKDSFDWRSVLCASTCLWAQYEQYRHHCFLAELRLTDDNETSEQDYRIPSKGWFQYVSCPHYLTEILIYISFALVLYSNGRGNGGYKPIALIVWVATNLTVSAIKSHDWYLLQYPHYSSLRRKAIVPFLF